MAPLRPLHRLFTHDDVIKWKHFPRYWPFVRGIHRSLVNSPHRGQWRGALIFSLICAWINGWVNNREAGDLSHRAHYDVIVKRFLNQYGARKLIIHALKLYGPRTGGGKIREAPHGARTGPVRGQSKCIIHGFTNVANIDMSVLLLWCDVTEANIISL